MPERPRLHRWCRSDGDSCPGGNPSDGTVFLDQPLDPDMPITVRACAGRSNAPLGEICFEPGMLPPATMFITDETVKTTNDTRCQMMSIGGFDICLIVTDFIPTHVRFTGNRPVVLWSAGTLKVTQTGILDVSVSN